MRTVDGERCGNEEQETKSPTSKVGSLSDLFQLISMEENASTQCSLIDAFLHTYRLFSTTEQVLLTADRKFWEVCHSDMISTQMKLKEINALRLLLSRWLRQPHVRDFDSLPGLAELHRFTSIVVSWYRTFQTRNAAITSTDAEKPGQWTSRYVDQPSQAETITISNIVFPNLEKRVRERMAYKLEYLSKHAEYRAKVLRSKYYDLDSNAPVGRTIRSRSGSRFASASQHTRSVDQTHSASVSPGSYAECLSRLNSFHVAEELTAIDRGLFMNLLLPELLNNVRNRPSPTYTATVDQFNRLVNVVQCSVLSVGQNSPLSPKESQTMDHQSTGSQDGNAPLAVAVWSNRNLRSTNNGQTVVSALETFYGEEHKRAEIITKWINIAWRLRELNNLNSLQAVLVALQIGTIRRLRHCWTIVELLYTEQYRRFEALNSLMDISENHERVRAYMRKHLEVLVKSERARRRNDDNSKESRSSDPPGMIPYLGIFMSDLTFLNTAQPDYVTASACPSTRPEATARVKILNSPTTSLDSHSSSGPSSGSSRTDLHLKLDCRRKSRSPAYSLESKEGKANIIQVPKLHSSKCRSREVSVTREEKLINFTKHIREASTLRDIYLLQFSASFYRLKSDPHFQSWFDGFPKLSESEAMHYSLLIEPKEKDCPAVSAPGVYDRLSAKKAFSDIHMWNNSRTLSSNSSPPTSERRRAQSRPRYLLRRPPRPSPSGNLPDSNRVQSAVTSPVDSPYHSSSDVDSNHSSKTFKYNTKNRFRSTSHGRQYSSGLLDISKDQYERPFGRQSARSISRSDCGSSDLLVRVTLHEFEPGNPRQQQKQTTDTQSFFRNVAKIGSTPNLVTLRKTNAACADSSTVIEKVSSTDSISDLITRVVTKFDLPLGKMTQYDLVAVRPGAPDRILSFEENAIRAFRRAELVQPNEIVNCALVRHHSSRSTITMGRLSTSNHPKIVTKHATYHIRSKTHPPVRTIFDIWHTTGTST
ncbi:hypothetical protein D915_001902 [Fasciola hepatica]|uniref:Uncharacterized protein n=1 Tax=Fasciola hepatica TaxID=6192 RepID=A0A4E0RIB3_FASHE|nr:hypothetical protein D915_001902 [Fasciola hepatica]